MMSHLKVWCFRDWHEVFQTLLFERGDTNSQHSPELQDKTNENQKGKPQKGDEQYGIVQNFMKFVCQYKYDLMAECDRVIGLCETNPTQENQVLCFAVKQLKEDSRRSILHNNKNFVQNLNTDTVGNGQSSNAGIGLVQEVSAIFSETEEWKTKKPEEAVTQHHSVDTLLGQKTSINEIMRSKPLTQGRHVLHNEVVPPVYLFAHDAIAHGNDSPYSDQRKKRFTSTSDLVPNRPASPLPVRPRDTSAAGPSSSFPMFSGSDSLQPNSSQGTMLLENEIINDILSGKFSMGLETKKKMKQNHMLSKSASSKEKSVKQETKVEAEDDEENVVFYPIPRIRVERRRRHPKPSAPLPDDEFFSDF